MVKVESWGYFVALIAIIILGTNFVANLDTIGAAYSALTNRADTRCDNSEIYITCRGSLRDNSLCEGVIQAPESFPNMEKTDDGYEGCRSPK
tara:strand:- start:8613 stop:8888 length:276 start_codon:yes stop_codon:yes gene_type:complete